LLDELTLSELNNYIRPKVIRDAISFIPGQPYAYKQHQSTLRNLNNLGIFKYADLKFTPGNDSLNHQLDLGINLTTMKNVRFEAEANVVTKSTGFSGPAVEASLSHGNMFQGANKLQLKIDGGYEWQWGSQSESQLGFHSYNVGFSSSFTMPRLVLPRKWIHASRNQIKNTVINTGFDFMNKVKYYRMYSVNARLDYNWRRSVKVSHSFSPVYLNSVKLLETTPAFDEIINSNPSIKKSFEEQFIVGMRYNAEINLISTHNPNQLALLTGVATSGNLIAVSQKLVSGETEGPDKFLGQIYAQFIRFTDDPSAGKLSTTVLFSGFMPGLEYLMGTQAFSLMWNSFTVAEPIVSALSPRGHWVREAIRWPIPRNSLIRQETSGLRATWNSGSVLHPS
jgi:hypothetical protein